MMLNNGLAVYLFRIAQAVKKGQHVNAPMVCPECSKDAEYVKNEADHIVICQSEKGVDLYYVIIACEGYWTVDPNDYGVPSENWQGLTDIEELDFRLAPYAKATLGWDIDSLPMDRDNKRELGMAIKRDPTISDKTKTMLLEQLNSR